jgi:hypothetical protein
MESSNYELYMKYTKLIEEQLEAFLSTQGVLHEDIVDLCMAGLYASHPLCLPP